MDKGTWSCLVFIISVATRAVSVNNATPLHAGGRSLRTARVRSDARISLELYIGGTTHRTQHQAFAEGGSYLRDVFKTLKEGWWKFKDEAAKPPRRIRGQTHPVLPPTKTHWRAAPGASLATTVGLDLLECTRKINYQILASKSRSDD